ncbi:MAG: hypothetical protein H6R19_1194 [Proteobacteria bacterium]|nr:hypothetical protein [Pseudomonadota bacterium]
MSRHISHPPPNGFDISRYEICKDWGVHEWAIALAIRYKVRTNWILGCGRGVKDTPKNMMEDVRNIAAGLFKDPIGPSEYLKPCDIRQQRLVKDQSVLDWLYPAVYLEDEFNEWLRRAIVWFVENPLDPFFNYKKSKRLKAILEDIRLVEETPAWVVREKIDSSDVEHYVSVDLNGTDEHVIADFVAWLNETRKKSGVCVKLKRKSKEDFDSWHKYRLLPYLDLSFYAEVFSIKIRNEDYATYLFNDDIEVSVDERIRRTTKINAENLISKGFVSSLIKQANLKISEP